MPKTLPISLDWTYLQPHLSLEALRRAQPRVRLCHQMLHARSGPGSDFLGWLDPATIISKDQLRKVKALARRLRQSSDVLVTIGIGGSYLGARAVIEALLPPHAPSRVLFAGNDLSSHSFAGLLNALKGRRYCLNVISKSGTTVEPAIAFRLLRARLEKSLGVAQARRRIVATTDARRGLLRQLAAKEGYETLVVPDAVGGRYSVLTAVGLLPVAFAGIDPGALLSGAAACARACLQTDLTRNPAYFYAAARNALFSQGLRVEILAIFEPRLRYLAEWWKQLFAESEGKEHTGILPTAVTYTTDLHSMGQWIQQGQRLAFETFLWMEDDSRPVPLPKLKEDSDQLNYLARATLHQVNTQAFRGTALAHHQGGVPNMAISMPALDAYHLGALIYFFEKACALSGYLLGVNPFDQPGVEAYKRNMFALLGKPGSEGEAQEVLAAAAEERAVVRFA